jgi:DNA-binding SARP family transcriptional activator/tetratricopeptide (TPR) repeat protein
VQVRLLGPVNVVADGVTRPVRGLRRKAVLATLALHAGEVVSTGLLVDVVWGQAAPSTAVNTMQSHVSHLRNVLGHKAAIVARSPGYVLDLGGDGTDVQVAERLLRQGTRSADPVLGAGLLREALALWRGQPLADVAGSVWLEEQAHHLAVLRVQVKRALSEARLAMGEHAQLLPDLEQMVADNPLDEQIHALLMTALYRAGRQADALSVYHRLRHTLAEELGIDPGQRLRELETAILRQDPALETPVAAGAVALRPVAREALAVPVPAQLPSAVAGFAGRDAELASLDAAMPAIAQARPVQPGTPWVGPAAMIISAVSGTAGVGKTALAVHWAHRVSGQFPDGQLYVNLQGFGPGETALDPGEVVRRFLDAFGVPVAQIPQGLDAQAGLYRSLLAGKRVLVVLDNARDAEQARPLLPGSPGCLAIVTSRNYLTGLVAADGAHPLALDLLTDAGARDLLALRLGAGRVAAEPEAVGEIIERCARLPLALALAAARAASQPNFPLAVIASELRRASCALDAFQGDDLATDVRAVFSWSYHALSADAAQLFGLLGLHPGPDISVAAVASLAAIPLSRARGLLAELTCMHLLTQHSPGRYAFHDLLRAYAAEQAHTHHSQHARDAAVHRVLDHYLHTSHHAAMLMQPYLDPVTLDPPQPGVIAGEPATAGDALGWFTAEHATLLAAVHLADGTGFAAHTWRLAWTLTTYLLRRGLWHDHAEAQQTGLDAARRNGDNAGEAQALHGLALGYARSGRLREAYPLSQQALRLFEKIGDHVSQATVHSQLGLVAGALQRPAEALSHSLRALDLYRAAGHRAGQVMVLNDIGYGHAELGNHQEALTYCQQALAAIQDLGERNWEEGTWHSLGYIHHQLGGYRKAVTCYQRSLDLSRELGDRYNEAGTLDDLGDVHRSAGDLAAARRAWAHALRIFDEIDHPDGDRVRTKLFPRGNQLHDGRLGQPPGRRALDSQTPEMASALRLYTS